MVTFSENITRIVKKQYRTKVFRGFALFFSTITYFSALCLHKQPFHRRLEYRLFIPQSWLWQEKNHIQSVTTPKWLYAALPMQILAGANGSN